MPLGKHCTVGGEGLDVGTCVGAFVGLTTGADVGNAVSIQIHGVGLLVGCERKDITKQRIFNIYYTRE